MFYVYILQSETTGRHYCGQTDNLKRRLAQHNNPTHHGTHTTKRFAGPWRVIWSKEFATRAEAMALEKSIKKRGIRRFLETQHTDDAGSC